MNIGMLGRKVGMTQVFRESDRKVVPVTVIGVGPCVVLQKKTPETDGYHAVQLGLVEKVGRKAVNKPMAGHLNKAGAASVRAIREFRGEFEDLVPGNTLTTEIFKDVKAVDIVGTSKGKGFQGVMKRHNFSGGRETHGSMSHRAPGSIGASSDPSRVFKGTRMAGKMGNARCTIKNLEVIKVDTEKNLILVKGGVPGGKGGLLLIQAVK